MGEDGTDKLNGALSDNFRIKLKTNPCKRHRFLPDVIQYEVWLYYRLLRRRAIVSWKNAVAL